MHNRKEILNPEDLFFVSSYSTFKKFHYIHFLLELPLKDFEYN